MNGKIELGTISHGTLRTIDLWHAFFEELCRVAPDTEWQTAFADSNGEPLAKDEDTLMWDVDNFVDMLNELAPEGVYFGAHIGDGADFGWWPDND